tara:strand:- start:54 stop:266 length:213 start_codon:yes stop_codon:yes gene_type:complete
MSYKEYLSREGFIYSKKNEAWIKGYGWGKSIKVMHLVKGLFEVIKGDEIIYSDFIKSFEEFKQIIKKATL